MKLNKWIANAFGYDLLRGSRTHALIERHLQKLFKLHRVECVIDVGANTGQYASKLLRNGYRGQIHSFEPIQETFDRLEKTAAGVANWFVYPFALGDQETQRTMNVLNHRTLSSFHVPSDFSRQVNSGAFAVEAEQQVEVRRLDELLPGILKGTPS